MSKLLAEIKKHMITAMKSKDKAKLDTLRLLIAKIEKEQIEKKKVLTDVEVQSVISKNIKELDKEIESYVAVGRSVEKQEAEKVLLKSYLPVMMTREEIIPIIDRAVELKRKGEIEHPMKYLGQRLAGKADMKLVMSLVKEYDKNNK